MKNLMNLLKSNKSRNDSSITPEKNRKKEKNYPEITVSVSTNVGKIRSGNEDNFFGDEIGYRTEKNYSSETVPAKAERYIFAVFDGIGGQAYGEEAACIAVEVLSDFRKKINSAEISQLPEIINDYVNEANRQICRMADERRCRRSGCTLAMVCIDNGTVYTFSVGDSRVYYFRKNKIRQISEDQTVAMDKLKAKIYTKKEARTSPDAHKITSFLGADNMDLGMSALEYKPFELSDGKLLICSDGLTDMCSDEEISDILASGKEHLSQLLIDKALLNGGADNATCIVIQHKKQAV